jgi:hypothetical protein
MHAICSAHHPPSFDCRLVNNVEDVCSLLSGYLPGHESFGNVPGTAGQPPLLHPAFSARLTYVCMSAQVSQSESKEFISFEFHHSITRMGA